MDYCTSFNNSQPIKKRFSKKSRIQNKAISLKQVPLAFCGNISGPQKVKKPHKSHKCLKEDQYIAFSLGKSVKQVYRCLRHMGP